jgi:putative ABC transport system permease protein
MLADLRYGLRGLLRAPGFAVAAILTLALGIGAATSIFSVADATLFRPLPYPQPERLVMVWDQLVKLGIDQFPLRVHTFEVYRQQDRIFDAAGVFWPLDRTLMGDQGAEEVSTMWVGENVLPMLGVRTSLGRVFTQEEYQKGGAVILGRSLFLRRFGGDPSIVGKTIRLDGISHTVAGVMASGFDFSLGAAEVDLWTALPLGAGQHWETLRMLARLRPGVSLPAAQAAMSAAAKHLEETEHPYRGPRGEDAGYQVKVVSLREQLLGEFRLATLILLSAVGLVLLIACVNVANLLLARAADREKEISVRRALGASNGRLMRQWMTEAGVLAVFGGALGMVASIWGVRILTVLNPSALPSMARIDVDGRALGFALAATAVVCCLFGLAPATFAASGMHWALKRSRRGSSPRRRAAGLLIAAEVALSVMLLVGAGLLLRSFAQLSHVDPGFNADHLLTMRLQYPPAMPIGRERSAAFFSELSEKLAALPGVVAAGSVSRLPAMGGGLNTRGGNPFSIEGRAWDPNAPVRQIAHTQMADADYFRALQIPLVDGRLFRASDGFSAPRVAVVNRTLANAFFPKGAIGQHIMLGAPRAGVPWLTIVGVVGDVKTAGLDQDTLPQFYTPVSQDPPLAMSIVLRTAGNPLKMANLASEVIHGLDPEMPVFDVKTMDDLVARTIAQPRFETVLLTFFAAAALLLAAVGIFGVVAHATARRTQEIGIRMALGADSGRVLRHVIFEGLRPVFIGLAAGIGGALVATKLVESVLFKVRANDPLTFLAAAGILIVVAAAACLAPARKATQVDPMIALRAE